MGASRELIRFGVFEFDPVAFELRRRGALVRMPDQSLSILAALLAQPGALVSRDELKRALWPDGTFVDFDGSLNFSVARLRRALGDDASAPLYVETVPRRGYRFVAPCAASAADRAPEQVARPLRRGSSWWRAAAGLVVGLALVQAGGAVASAPLALARTALERAAPAARAAYLRGQYQSATAAGGATSLAAFREAARLEPANALFREALAAALVRAVEEGRLTPRQGLPEARVEAQAALGLASSAGAELTLAQVALRLEWNWDDAERHLGRALALDPATAEGHLVHAELLLLRGEPGLAVSAAAAAERLDPVCPLVRGRVARSYYAARRYAEAADAWRRAAQIAPRLVDPHERLVHVYRQEDRPREAALESAEVLERLGASAQARALRAGASASAERAVQLFIAGTIAHLTAEAERTPALLADRMAVLHAALGQREQAFAWLDRAVQERAPGLPVTLATDPDLDPLRNEPRFRQLMGRLSLG